MATWYHGWRPLPFEGEGRIDSNWTLDAVTVRDMSA
jgi:hypothetical protein